MKMPALFRAVMGSGASRDTVASAVSTPLGASATSDVRAERRRPVYRCFGCHAWKPAVLVYMSNGGHYCPRCARAVHAWSGARPAGRRFDDVLSIDEGIEATTPDRLTV